MRTLLGYAEEYRVVQQMGEEAPAAIRNRVYRVAAASVGTLN